MYLILSYWLQELAGYGVTYFLRDLLNLPVKKLFFFFYPAGIQQFLSAFTWKSAAFMGKGRIEKKMGDSLHPVRQLNGVVQQSPNTEKWSLHGSPFVKIKLKEKTIVLSQWMIKIVKVSVQKNLTYINCIQLLVK